LFLSQVFNLFHFTKDTSAVNSHRQNVNSASPMAAVYREISYNFKYTSVCLEKLDENNFHIAINNKTYNVNVSYEGVSLSRYKIETDCEYLFTLYMDKEGTCKAENDVKLLDENFIETIGRAIEEHDGR
jgi:hypothetical protein